MLTSSGQVTVTVTEVDPVLETEGEFITVTVSTGATGPAGPVGATGATGPAGPAGADGADGDSFVPDPTAEGDGRMLEVQSGALVYTDPPAGAFDGAYSSLTGVPSTFAPAAHATSHQDGGTDELALDGSQITAGTVADARIASTIARDSEVTAAVSTHEGLSDPHPGYLTTAEGDAAYQPKDSDLTAIAALTTTSYGRAFLALADAAAGRTALGLGTAATTAASAYEVAGAAAAAQAASQPLDSDLTALAALTTTAFGRSLLEAANASALRTLAGLVLGTDIYSKSTVDSTFAPLASPALTGNPTAPTASAGDNDTSIATTAFVAAALTKQAEVIMVALSDETTAITTGTAKLTMRMPWAFTLTAVRASLTTASSSGIPTVDINEAGTTILSTKLTIDASELTSTTAATAAVISDASLADDAEITFDIDVAGTGAKGLKVYLLGTRT